MTDIYDNPDNLELFFDIAENNRKGNIARFPEAYDVLRRVNICLSTAGKHLVNPNPVMAGVLFLRCNFAYKTAVSQALSGQVCEAFVTMRSCLEYAGCAIMIHHDPSLERVFTDRHIAPGNLAIHKRTFQVGNMKTAIAAYDQKLADNFDLFYQRCIDFGAHPNPHATFSAMEMTLEQKVKGEFTSFAMVTDKDTILHASKSVGQVGLTALYVFQHIYTAKFGLLGIRQEMNK